MLGGNGTDYLKTVWFDSKRDVWSHYGYCLTRSRPCGGNCTTRKTEIYRKEENAIRWTRPDNQVFCTHSFLKYLHPKFHSVPLNSMITRHSHINKDFL
ncbi:hypothetical protein AVEN_67876-1 [Araneus ventricosus]|uniref:Uncharacterized protein n=1 Tax=Araneus ventricosus TaxID=182803 RepID=A0A4Y2VWT0_ARAVE|nr:hypothetical protein AVEN_67876-1 [Araneus ventricosus]